MPTPQRSTCETSLPNSIIVSGITSNGTQCRQIGAAGIGILEIIESGYIDAVDVWGYLGAGLQVCFRATGSLIFLDAANSPRRPEPMPAYSYSGMTCAFVEQAGTLVLVPGPAPPAILGQVSLTDCAVTTIYLLNFREKPAGDLIDILPAEMTLTATARTVGWFQADYFGKTGWVSADYVTTAGNCG